jgi:alkanesulfonate monooxygenase SsuD/methylene tetrahydromethanopterin reductase-like flavin-dependent oxidoreductase (luciferase family)
MKFILNLMPTVPASLQQRAALRPIAARTDRFQAMLREASELARMAEDFGFSILTTVEHHLHEEGLEMGGTSAFHHFLASQTKHIKVGPIGYVLPAWNPLRLALETAWLDQLTRGRAIVGLARGYQTRWFNNMGQKYGTERGSTIGGVAALANTSRDEANRALFEEVFDILKLSWGDKPFSYRGRFWEYPYPYEEGTEWPAQAWTEKYGTPGIVVDGKLKQINVVPKPFQKPHPQLHMAFTHSVASIKWAAEHGAVPTITLTNLPTFQKNAEMYRDEARKVGRNLALGENIACGGLFVLGDTREAAMKLAEITTAAIYYREFGGGFGWWEGFRLPGDEEKWPAGKVKLPESEWTMERLERAGNLTAGTATDIRRMFDKIAAAGNPEFMSLNLPQGFVPFEDTVRYLRTLGEQIMPHYM